MTTSVERVSRPTGNNNTTRAGRRISVRARPYAQQWVSGAVGAAAGLVLFLVAYRGLSDDAYITLAFAQNVAFHGEWAVTPGLVSNTATSPLYVLTLSIATVITRGPVVSLGLVLMASLAITSTLTSAIARRCGWAWWAGPVVAILLATSPLMASTLGLESFLLIAVLTALLYAVVRGHAASVGATSALMFLTRPDAAVIATVAILVLVASRPTARASARAAAHVTATAVAMLAPWTLLSIWLFQTPIPDTLVWKTAQTQGLGGALYGDAIPLFLDYWPAATALSVALVLLGLAALFGWLQLAPTHPVTVVLGAGGALHSLVMAGLEVPPFTWYYAPTTAAAALLIALGLAAALPRTHLSVRPPLGFALGGPVVLLVMVCVMFAAQHDFAAQGHPFHANFATPQQYQIIAESVPADAVLEAAHGEVGALAFYCACTVVDPLSDRGRLSPIIAAQLAKPGLKGEILRLLYARWEPTDPVSADFETCLAPGLMETIKPRGAQNDGSTEEVPR